jgi:hypothetical protein
VKQPIQHFSTEHPEQAHFFPVYLNALYDADIVDYEDIVSWYKSEESRGKGKTEANDDEQELWKKLWTSGGRFVKALAEAQESDDEDDEDEDDEDSD